MLHNKINALGFDVKRLHKFKTKKQPNKPTKNTLKNPKLTKKGLKVIQEKKKSNI